VARDAGEQAVSGRSIVSEPRRASELVRSIVRETGRRVARSGVTRALDEILAPAERECCQVLSFRAGRLLVEVTSAPLYAELCGFRREDIRARINGLLPEQQVAVLHFRLGGKANV
jgi:hypothetical protein